MTQSRIRMCIPWPALMLIMFTVSLGLAQYEAQRTTGDAVLGKAGKVFISEDEFIRRFELIPGLNRQRLNRLNEEKLIVMYSLVAEKLLAQEAEAQKIDLDSGSIDGIRDLTETLARDELYRKEIAGSVEVTAQEVAQGMSDALRIPLVTFMMFQHEADARFVRAHIHRGALLSTLVDSTMHATIDTVSIVWGNAEWEIEKSAFALRSNEISPVVGTSQGWYLLQLTKESKNVFYAGMAPDVRRERVTKQIRLRKEERRLRSYMASFLQHHAGYGVAPAIKRLAIALSGTMAKTTQDSAFIVDKPALDSARMLLASSLGDTLVVAGQKSWNIGEILERLFRAGFIAPSRDPLTIANALNRQCRVWSEQEMLGQDAMRRGLDQAPDVQRDLKEWRASYLAQIMRQRIEDSVSITDADVYRYLERYGKPLPTPRVQIRQLWSGSLEVMEGAIRDLESHVPFEEVVKRYSTDPDARNRGGLTEFFKITDRSPIGEIASQLAPGQIAGPIAVAKGYLIIQLISRKDSMASDTAMVRRKQETATELLRLARKSRLEEFIARSAEKNGFAVFEDRLFSMKVSPIPMLAFRVIGFGGRMFAAPFLPRLFEWINLGKQGGAVLP